ncbi:MAG: hypothetical protein ABFR32_12265 [Bacteroidota bacterium]
MKTLIKTKKAIIITIVLLAIFSFTMIQLNQEKELIIGTWINSETPEWKWHFKTDGKCYDYLGGQLSDTYTYSITEEVSKNGKLKHSFLRLVNIYKANDEYEYEINTLNTNKLVLEYLDGSRSKLIYFNKNFENPKDLPDNKY